MTDEEYCDLIFIDFLIQMSKGVDSKDCRVRYSKEDLEKAAIDED
jgi:hypothetical protein